MAGSAAVRVAGDIDHDNHVFVSDSNRWAVASGGSGTFSNPHLDLDSKIFVSHYNKWAVNIGLSTLVGSGRCTFSDGRDGRLYTFVLIGDQVWMGENLAWLPAVSPSSA
jgi:hypothetical protein